LEKVSFPSGSYVPLSLPLLEARGVSKVSNSLRVHVLKETVETGSKIKEEEKRMLEDASQQLQRENDISMKARQLEVKPTPDVSQAGMSKATSGPVQHPRIASLQKEV